MAPLTRTLIPALLATVVMTGCSPEGPSAPTSADNAADQLSLAWVFTDHMVIQRDQPIRVWGRGRPGRVVTVRLDESTRLTHVRPDGRWELTFPPRPAGGPIWLHVSDGREELDVSDVLIGDVWLCSGQSNMEWPLRKADTGPQALAEADHPRLRLLKMPRASTPTEQSSAEANWQRCTPKAAAGFSAVGYFFGRSLGQELDVPIGLIDSTWGGSPAVTWTSGPALLASETFAERYRLTVDRIATFDQRLARWQREEPKLRRQFLRDWQKTLDEIDQRDEGIAGGWYAADVEPAGWQMVTIPQRWRNQGGIRWYRTTVDLPADWAGADLVLHLGAIDDADQTWFNGRSVGVTDLRHDDHWKRPRAYRIPADVLRQGENVVAVRVMDYGGNGGFTSDADALRLTRLDEPNAAIYLARPWWMRTTATDLDWDDLPRPPRRPTRSKGAHDPARLFNGMIAPLVNMPLRGVIWYQGEADTGRNEEYRQLFPLMIRDWRERWGRPELPFLWVNLANYRPHGPDGDNWAYLREAQTQTLALPATAQALAIDVGDPNDIHPRDKRTVGRRLASAALAVAHGRDVPYQGPMYRSMEVRDGRAVVTFDHATGGLVARGPALEGFEIAGADRQFVPARAKIDGETVIVWSDRVADPLAVRYAWKDDPDATLYNHADLPAVPFRTDNWPREP